LYNKCFCRFSLTFFVLEYFFLVNHCLSEFSEGKLKHYEFQEAKHANPENESGFLSNSMAEPHAQLHTDSGKQNSGIKAGETLVRPQSIELTRYAPSCGCQRSVLNLL
jgi:hypothetical protein